MSTATQQAPHTEPQVVAKTIDLLEAVIQRSEAARDGVVLALRQADLIEKVLPPQMKGQGQRLADRAALEFERNPDLQKCTPRSFIRAVVEAAELGLAIDGRLAHAVPFNNHGTKEAQLILDYKGIIAVARRSGTIRDAYGDNVHEKDTYHCRRVNDSIQFFHERPPMGQDRGKCIGAYCVIKMPGDGEFRVEEMDGAQIEKIRAAAPGGNSPAWKNHRPQMEIKTVVRRALKTVADDPAFIRACEIDDREILGEAIERTIAKKATRSSLNDTLPPVTRPLPPAQQSPAPEATQAPVDPVRDEASQEAPDASTEGVDEQPQGDIQAGIDRQAIRSKFEVMVAGDEPKAKALYDSICGPDSNTGREDADWAYDLFQATLKRIAEMAKPKGKKKEPQQELLK